MAPNGAGKCCGGCRRGKAAHAGAGAMAGFVMCLLVVWAIVGCRRSSSGRVVDEDGMLGQFNLSKSQLQALVSILASTERECMEKSGLIHDGNQVNSIYCIPDTLCIRDKISDGKQNWLKDAILQKFCRVQDKYGVNTHAPAVLEDKFLQNVIQEDISSTTQGNPHEYDLYAGINGVNVVQNIMSSSKHTVMLCLSALFGSIVISVVKTIHKRRIQSNKLCVDGKVLQIPSAKISRKWSKRALLIGVLLGLCSSICIFSCMYADVVARRIENLSNMCDERARMLQDQFNVSTNHVHALAILVSTFHHGKNPSAIHQVLHSEREQFEQQHGWKIKKMEAGDQSLVHDYNPEKLEPSPVQDEYAPVIFSQETVKHIISIDMMSGKEDHDNILRSRATGRGALTSPFKLLKSNHLGVVLTFAVYKYDLPPNATPEERIHATLGFKYEPPLPWSAITISTAVVIIVLLVGHIIYATLNSLEKAEHDYRVMRELKGRAEAADVAKSQFLATVSHEIRTPVNGVLGMLQMLMDTELDTTQQDFVVTAQESGKALINLINEVLDLAKIESGRIELETVPFDVRDIIDNVVSLFYEKSQAKGIELAVLVSDQVPYVLIGDPWRFRQIITNLVGNSMKFTERGHIFVQVHLVEELKRAGNIFYGVSAQNRKVLDDNDNMKIWNTLSGLEVADSWKSLENFRIFKNSSGETDTINLVVRVEDTGIGITEDAQLRIFTPFMQADSSTSRTYGGTGIGLSITKSLVELMGGEIGFTSKSGVGSTFSFTAIFKENRKGPGDIKIYYFEPTPSDFQGMRALIIDGRNARAEITIYHLQRLGIQCNLVATSESAFSMLLEACTSRSSTKGLKQVFSTHAKDFSFGKLNKPCRI
ncbi:hypothetical protein PVAP13_9KG357000 [Panicum virgatum]|uniref:histidine kinase n=1 Tax=Panicum virgatum TaxID=38727 RepID=A0A8T0NS18_PANVG|nr:hypothetical protein PVAP13_9KG357000 [Panicum virgatum]